MTNEYKPDPQAVVEFMCDVICRDNQVTGKIDFNEGFVTIEGEDGQVWRSKVFTCEYEDGMRVEYLKSVFDLFNGQPPTSIHETDIDLINTMAEIAGFVKYEKVK